MKKTDSIFIAGHRGLVGSSLVRLLEKEGYHNLILKTHSQLDLMDQSKVNRFFDETDIDYVFLAAARVGGIWANSMRPVDFLYENLMIQSNVIHAASKTYVQKLLFLGSSCIYPKLSPQPVREEYLLSGMLEETNESYAVAKIAGIKLCQAHHKQNGIKFISAMPCNLYGPHDQFSLNQSHVIPGMIRKFHEAKQHHDDSVILWGSGTPFREFLFVDDLSRALLKIMECYEDLEPINVGSSQEVSIRELAELVKDVVGCSGSIEFNPLMPDGTTRKILDSSKIRNLDWFPEVSLKEGLKRSYEWALEHVFNT